MPDQVARNAAQQIAVEICRELYDCFAMGGLEPQDEHEYVAEQIESALAPMREALQAIVDDAKNRNEPGGTWVLVAGGLIDRAAEVLKGDE